MKINRNSHYTTKNIEKKNENQTEKTDKIKSNSTTEKVTKVIIEKKTEVSAEKTKKIFGIIDWDLSSFSELTLGKFIFFKFIELVNAYFLVNSMTPDQEDAILDFVKHFKYLVKDKSQKSINLKFAHAFNDAINFLEFSCLEKLCLSDPELLHQDLREILGKEFKSLKTSQKQEIPNYVPMSVMFTNALYNIARRKAIEYNSQFNQNSVLNAATINRNFNIYVNEINGAWLGLSAHERDSKEWIERAKLLQEQVLSYRRFNKKYIKSLTEEWDILIKYHMLSNKIKKYYAKHNIVATRDSLKEIMQSGDKKKINLVITLTKNLSEEQRLTELYKTQLQNFSNKRKKARQNENQQIPQYQFKEDFDKNKYVEQTKFIFVDLFQMIDEYIGIVTDLFMDTLQLKSNPHSKDNKNWKYYWLGLLQEEKLNTEKIEDKPVQTIIDNNKDEIKLELSTIEEKIESKEEIVESEESSHELIFKVINDEREKNSISKENISIFSLSIVKFHSHLARCFSVDQHNHTDLENISSEIATHFNFLGSDLCLMVECLTQNDLGGLFVISCSLLRNLHTIFEQLMQKKYFLIHECKYLESHLLKDLSEELGLENQLGSSFSQLMELLNACSVQTRYLTYFENQYANHKNKPEVLAILTFLKQLAENSIQGNAIADEKNLIQVKSTIDSLFQILLKGYLNCFDYLEKIEKIDLSSTLTSKWKEIFDYMASSFDTQFEKMIEEKITLSFSLELDEDYKPYLDAIAMLDQTIEIASENKNEFGNPILPLCEAKQQILKFITAKALCKKYDYPFLNSLHLRNLLVIQWMIEQSLQALCILRQIPPFRSHNFHGPVMQLLSDFEVEEEEIQDVARECFTLIEPFNGSIGLNYPNSYDNGTKWLKEFHDQITFSTQYIDSNIHHREELDSKIFEEIEKNAKLILIKVASLFAFCCKK